MGSEPAPRGRSLSRADAVTLGLALAIAAGALLARTRLPAVPFAVPDSGGYLVPAIRWLLEGHYQPMGGRQFPYPFFLAGVIRVFGTLGAVPIIQHLLGVLGGLLLLAAWLRIPLPETAPRGLEAVRRGVGLLLLAASCGVAQTVAYEQHLQPEGLSQPLLGLLLYLLAALFASDPRAQPGATVGRATAALFVASAVALLRPQTLFLAPAAALGVALFLGWRRAPPRVLASALLLPSALSLALLFGPELALSKRDPEARRIASARLFFWHFHLEEDALRQELARGSDLPPREQALRRDLLAAYDRERERHARSGRHYRFQDYNPCSLYYGAAGRALRKTFAGDEPAFRRFCMDHFWAGVRRHPLGYASKVAANLSVYYRWPGGLVYNPSGWVEIERFRRDSLRNLRGEAPTLRRHPAGGAYLAALAVPAGPERILLAGSRSLSRLLERLLQALAGASTPALLALLVALIGRIGRPARDGPLAGLALTAAAMLLGANLTAAAVHGLETPRYILALSPLSLFATACALWCAGLRAACALRRRHAPGAQGSIGP